VRDGVAAEKDTVAQHPGTGELCVRVTDDELLAAPQDLLEAGVHLLGVGLESPRLNPSADGAVLPRYARGIVEQGTAAPLELAGAPARTRLVAASDTHRAETVRATPDAAYRRAPPAGRIGRHVASNVVNGRSGAAATMMAGSSFNPGRV
jgi:hypothetical protein